jgi:rubrerythrin
MEDVTLKRAVEFAVATEEVGARAYKHMAEKLKDDEEIHPIFLRLAQDELAHEQYFRTLLEKIPNEPGPKDYDEGLGVLKAMSMSEFFSTRDGLKKDLEGVNTRDEALRRAFELEKATLNYYRALKDVMGDSDAVDGIIKAEKEHLTTVMKVMLTEAKFRGLGDSF